MDEVSYDVDVYGLFVALSHDGDGDRVAHGSPHKPHRLDKGHVLGGLVVHLDDPVAGFDAGLVSGCPLYGSHHGQYVVLDGHLDAQPPELAFGLDLHLLEDLGSHVGGVGV